jgi:hypothetical protein
MVVVVVVVVAWRVVVSVREGEKKDGMQVRPFKYSRAREDEKDPPFRKLSRGLADFGGARVR